MTDSANELLSNSSQSNQLKRYRVIRTMRGRTQASLLRLPDGREFVTKFQCNRLGTRVLASEWIGAKLMKILALPLPDFAVINIRNERMPDANVPTGIHFGSQYPQSQKVYDFIPECLFPSVPNLSTFRGAFVFDVWVMNSDFRQAIFVRHECEWDRPALKFMFVDNSHLFGGLDWRFAATEKTGIGLWNTPYTQIRNWRDFSPWIEQIETLAPPVIHRTIRSVPEDWLTKVDRNQLNTVCETLEMRRRSLRRHVQEALSQHSNHFPSWGSS